MQQLLGYLLLRVLLGYLRVWCCLDGKATAWIFESAVSACIFVSAATTWILPDE